MIPCQSCAKLQRRERPLQALIDIDERDRLFPLDTSPVGVVIDHRALPNSDTEFLIQWAKRGLASAPPSRWEVGWNVRHVAKVVSYCATKGLSAPGAVPPTAAAECARTRALQVWSHLRAHVLFRADELRHCRKWRSARCLRTRPQEEISARNERLRQANAAKASSVNQNIPSLFHNGGGETPMCLNVWNDARGQCTQRSRLTCAGCHSSQCFIKSCKGGHYCSKECQINHWVADHGGKCVKVCCGSQWGVEESAYAYIRRRLFVKDVHTSFREGDSPKGHVIVCAPTAAAASGILASLRSNHALNTALNRMVVFLVERFTDDADDVYSEMRELGACCVVEGVPTVPRDLERAGIDGASCLLLIDCDKAAEDILGADAHVMVTSSADTGVHAKDVDDSGFGKSIDSVSDAPRIFNYILVERALSTVVTSPNLRVVLQLATSDALPILDYQRRRFLASSRKIAALKEGVERRPNAAAPADRGLFNQIFGTDDAGEKRREYDSIKYGVLERSEAEMLHPTVDEVRAARTAAKYSLESPLASCFNLPFFASGSAVVRSIFSNGAVTSYYSASTMRIIEEFLAPVPDQGSRLIAEPLPRCFNGKTFSFLNRTLRDSAQGPLDYRAPLPIALYRPRSAYSPHAPHSTFVLNPDPLNTILHSTEEGEDVVYFLALAPVWNGTAAVCPGVYTDEEKRLHEFSRPAAPLDCSSSCARMRRRGFVAA